MEPTGRQGRVFCDYRVINSNSVNYLFCIAKQCMRIFFLLCPLCIPATPAPFYPQADRPLRHEAPATGGVMATVKRKLRAAQAEEAQVSAEELLKFYRDMLLIRRFEEKAGQMYGMGLIGGFCHLYIGQEAVVVGMQAATREGDSVITSYRGHGHMLASGMDPKGVMGELTGRSTGYSHGKGGSMHMFSRDKHFYGGHGIVGAQVPIGTGLAFAHRYKNDGNVSLTYLGDGAINQGQVYESFNMAALWKLPVVYIIENNRYSMGTSLARHSASHDLYVRAQPYAIPGGHVDGMNVLAVKAAADVAFEHARSR